MQTRPQRQRKQGSWGLFALEGEHVCSALKTPPEERSCLLPLTQSHLLTSLTSVRPKDYTPLSIHIPQEVLCAGINSLNKHPDLMPHLSATIWETLGFSVCTQKKAHLDTAWGCRTVLCWLFEGFPSPGKSVFKGSDL